MYMVLFYDVFFVTDRQKQAERRKVEENRAAIYGERDKERKRKQLFGSFKVCLLKD